MPLYISKNPQKFPKIFLKLFRVHFTIVNIFLDFEIHEIICRYLKNNIFTDVLFKGNEVCVKCSFNHSQKFLSEAVGAPLCLPLLLKPLVSIKATSLPTTLWISSHPQSLVLMMYWWGIPIRYRHFSKSSFLTLFLLSLGLTERLHVLAWKQF